MQGIFLPSVQKGKRSCRNIGGILYLSNDHELLKEIRMTMHKEPFPLKGKIVKGPKALGEWVSIQEIGWEWGLVGKNPLPLFKLMMNATSVEIMGTQQLYENLERLHLISITSQTEAWIVLKTKKIYSYVDSEKTIPKEERMWQNSDFYLKENYFLGFF